MATPIDCSAYYIHSDFQMKSSQPLCNNNLDDSGNSGSGFSVSKYLIDRSGIEIEQNSSRSAANPCQDRDIVVCVVDNPADVARNEAANAVVTGNDVRISGHVRLRSVRGRLRRVMCGLESFLRDMKVVLYSTHNSYYN